MEKQYKFFLENKSESESGGPDRKNMFKWKINFDGPKNSDYEGGKFHVEVLFDKDNPEKIPSCRFLNDELLHPNINENGRVCFGYNFKWNNDSTILDILNALYFLLKYPNFGDGYDNQQVKDFYEADPISYHRTVRELVNEFHQK